MKCGNCKTEGVTVVHVKECYAAKYAAKGVVHVAPAKPSLPSDLDTINRLRPHEDIEGIYVACDGSAAGAPVSFYKVVTGTNTGNVYVKRWDGAEWVYEGRRPLHFITTADKVTAEQAARFGRVTGSCVFCSRKLTDERSIAVGYGPTCADNQGLPWGEVSENDAVTA